jgi:hypothetical protein
MLTDAHVEMGRERETFTASVALFRCSMPCTNDLRVCLCVRACVRAATMKTTVKMLMDHNPHLSESNDGKSE